MDDSQKENFHTWKDSNHASNLWNVNKNNKFCFYPKMDKNKNLILIKVVEQEFFHTRFGRNRNWYLLSISLIVQKHNVCTIYSSNSSCKNALWRNNHSSSNWEKSRWCSSQCCLGSHTHTHAHIFTHIHITYLLCKNWQILQWNKM